MTKFQQMATATISALALLAGASAASAQSWGFNQAAGTPVTATGQLNQNVLVGGVIPTKCNVTISGVVGPNGNSIIFNSYVGTQVPGDGGNLACGDSLFFPITATATGSNEINLDEFEVGTRGGPCYEADYKLAYAGNVATFNGVPFGSPPICIATGNIALTANGSAVNIVAK
ncbi:hypothetical protein [Brevundimonas diminuta]|uniref:hypothetical protein n=1 Tax=Brevundimonas diminuta TaxID=293 RepID=UPI0030F8C43B